MAPIPVSAGNYLEAGGICFLRQCDHTDSGSVCIFAGAGLSGTGNYLFGSESVMYGGIG